MVVAGLYESMFPITKSIKSIPSLNHLDLTESIHMSALLKKYKKKQTMAKSTLNFKSKPDEVQSSLTRIVMPHYTLRNIEINKEHMHYFRIVSFILIAADSIVLSVDSIYFSEQTRKNLRLIDFGFLLAFYLEITVKLMFQKHFFKRFLNLVDILIFILNLSFQIYFAASDCEYLSNNPNCCPWLYDLIRVFQVLRLLRIMISSLWIKISILILEFLKILQKMKFLLVLLMIFLILFSLIGKDMFKFSNITDERIIPEEIHRFNFNGFMNAFFSNFIIFIDEEWHLLMFSHMKTFSSLGASLFFVFNLVFCTIFLNKLFLAVLISNLIEAKNIKSLVRGQTILPSFLAKLINRIKELIQSCSVKRKKKESSNIRKETKNLSLKALTRKIIQLTTSLRKNTNKKKSIKTVINEIQKHRYFSNFMILSVISSMIFLAMDDPFQSAYAKFNRVILFLNIAVFIVFTIELLFELITHENGYFSFSILMKSVLCLAYLLLFTLDFKFLKVILLFRLFFLLHFSKDLKLAFGAFLRSIGDILQLFLFFLLICILFALIGVKCLKGSFFYCDGLTEEFVEKVFYKQDCLDFGGDWVNRDFNFDNIFYALETMFIVANTEGWIPIMY